MRSGNYIKQPSGYRAFVPAPLPPDPPISMDAELTKLLSRADHALGRLDGVGAVLPNPDLFVAMYVRQEAVLSSQIEGTQSTLEDILQFEVDDKSNGLPRDVEEVVKYDKLVEQLVKLNILKETTGGQRNRRYSYFPYLALFESSTSMHRK